MASTKRQPSEVDWSRPGRWVNCPVELVWLLLEAGVDEANRRAQALVKAHSRRQAGKNAWMALKPGSETPLWNGLRRQLRPHLRRYGSQATLGRILGLSRQQINAFVTGGGRMPDAERTLAMLVWLHVVRRRPPALKAAERMSSNS